MVQWWSGPPMKRWEARPQPGTSNFPSSLSVGQARGGAAGRFLIRRCAAVTDSQRVAEQAVRPRNGVLRVPRKSRLGG